MKNSSPPSPASIDWESQWAQFAPDFRQGKAHIELEGKTLLLQPGPGFGDLSHPTTALMLACMQGEVQNQSVLDIGCGSGILSLAALLLGAKRAIGIDIDEGALLHAQQNAKLNKLEKLTYFSKTLPSRVKGIVLINMILSEQATVLEQIPDLPSRASLWICSGILVTQKEQTLAFLQQFGLSCLEEKQEGEWLALKCSILESLKTVSFLKKPS